MFYCVLNAPPIIVSGYVSVFSVIYSTSNQIKFRNSRSQMSFKIDVFQNFAIFTGKQLRWSLVVIKVPAFLSILPNF